MSEASVDNQGGVDQRLRAVTKSGAGALIEAGGNQMKKFVILAMVIGLVTTVAKFFLGDEGKKIAVMSKIRRPGGSDAEMRAT